MRTMTIPNERNQQSSPPTTRENLLDTSNADILEALRQNAFRMENFYYGVKMNDAPRRNADAPEVNQLGD